MDKFRQKYIELQKAFWDSDDEAGSILALYEFKDELEKRDEAIAKLVLVDIYELLDMKKSAYELLAKICDPKDKKQLKKLGYLAQYKQDGDEDAIRRPKTASQKINLKERETAEREKPAVKITTEQDGLAARKTPEREKRAASPHFRYHPDPFKTGVFKEGAGVVCECCECETDIYYRSSLYCVADVKYLCPHCIASGAAAAKFDASFVQDADPLPQDAADAQAKSEELFRRTPGYFSWQGEHWLACCDDYCEFLGDVGTKELAEMGIAEEVFADYAARGEFAIEGVRDYLVAGGDMAGYLFRCKRCGKYKIYVDAS